jgi:hypothetical protein
MCYKRQVIAFAIGTSLSITGCGGREAALQQYKIELELLNRVERQQKEARDAENGDAQFITGQVMQGTDTADDRARWAETRRVVDELLQEKHQAQKRRVDEAKAALDQFDDH